MASGWATLVALVLMVSGLGVIAETPASAAVRADLRITAVSPTTTEVHQTSKLETKVTLRNAGKKRSSRSVTALYLSLDARRGKDLKLGRTWTAPALRAGKSRSTTIAAKVPRKVATGAYYVIACADIKRQVRESREGNNCRTARRKVEVLGPPSSHDLIDAAVASGTLTAEQGLVYKVFSDFKDPRLPEEYSAPPDGLDHGALSEAAESWSTLSAKTRATLRPFLIPPYYAGSHWSPATPRDAPSSPTLQRRIDAPWCTGVAGVGPLYNTWDHLDTSSGKVRIWWLHANTGDATTATHLVAELDSKILPALKGLMGRGPKSDDGGVCDGGSPAVDIALVDAATATTVTDGSCGASGTSVHMVFPRTAPAVWAGLDPYLAHEMMHAIQYAMPVAGDCGDYAWLRDMTAQWTQDFVTDPSYGIGVGPDDTEFQAAPIYLDHPDVPLDVMSPPAKHEYGDYMLALWAVRNSGPAIVRAMWDAAATRGPVQAVNNALPGGFEATWADFALSNWNQGPVTDYRDWDGLTDAATTIGTEPIAADKTRTPTINVKHLAAKYLELDVEDPKLKEIEFTNDIPGDKVGKVRAVITYDHGSDAIVDLSGQKKTSLCIDDGTKRATKVVLIFSNAHMSADKTFKPTLVGKKTCGCANSSQPGAMRAAPVCEGTAGITWTVTEHITSGQDYDSTSTTTGTLKLNMVETKDHPGSYKSGPGSTYDVHQTKHTELYRHNDGRCGDEIADVTDEGSGALEPGLASGLIVDSGQFWLNTLVPMATTWTFHNNVICVGPQDETMDSQQVLPECPPDPNTFDTFYEFKPSGPQSKSFTFSCSGSTDYTDGAGRHQITVTVDGTLALTQKPG